MPSMAGSAASIAKPVILLAFANDPADGINYLRNLSEEARQLRAAVEYAEAQGLCEYALLYNATLDDILAAFQNPKYKGRIAAFHYGGHAESYELLFQSRENELQRVDGRGFAAFLAEQRGLQLVFLNACTTEPQVEGLLAANVQVVIATTQEVDDGVAAGLAAAFYGHLARGDSIGSAYRQAVAAQRAQRGDDPALFYVPGGGPPPDAPATATPATATPVMGDAQEQATPVDGDGGSSDTAGSGAPSTLAAATPGEAAAVKPPGAEVGGAASGGYWPWMLRTRRGAEAAVEWSLPLAAGDPLFGLPALPPKPLPPSPYQRGLDYYTRDLAELFFGRSREIRDLYQRVTAAGRSRVILYYGQSGVGKSSLLDAGLAPRLEATHVVAYARRERSLGLLGTLRRQLATTSAGREPDERADMHGAGGADESATTSAGREAEGIESIPAASGADESATTSASREPDRSGIQPRTGGGPTGRADTPAAGMAGAPSLAALWLAAERRAGKPVVLILDQVEEAFTRRNPELPQELAEFAVALRTLDAPPGDDAAGGASAHTPAGVLLLGFRKERLAELETALRAERIDFAKVYLAPLGADGIEDVFWGPVRNARLAAKYGLSVEDELPQLVAHDLTADPDSPVAPTLQILLRKLWAAATAQRTSTPEFTVARYEQLRREGILLDDFLRQQIAVMAGEHPDAVASGFLLDLWARHTTDLGTAEQCDTAELYAAYPHRNDLEAVIQRSKDLYVLVDPTGDNNGSPAGAEAADGVAAAAVPQRALGRTRLAHDTLAPLVRRLYEHSTLPGQQARRLLDSRLEVWEGNPKALLDDPSLALVERGLKGTCAPTEAEEEFLAGSRAARSARKRNRQLLLAAAAAAVVLLLGMLGLTVQLRTDQQLANAASTQIAATATIDAAFKDARATTIAATATIAAAFADARATAAAASIENERVLTSIQRLNTQLANERERNAAQLAQANEAQRLAQLAQQQLAVDPVVSLHLALAALPQSPSEPLIDEAAYALRQAVLTSRERKYITATLDSAEQVAIRGNRIALGGPQPAIYDLELNPQEFPLPPDFTNIVGLRWGNDGRLLGWNDTDAWVTGGGEPLHFALADQGVDTELDMIRCAEWQPVQRWVAICTMNNLYAWQPESGRVIPLSTELDTAEFATFPRSAIWSSDSRRLAGLGARLVVWDSRFPGVPAQAFYAPAELGNPVSFAAWLPPPAPDLALSATITAGVAAQDDELLAASWLVAGDSAPALQLWRPGAAELQTLPLTGGFGGLDVTALSLPGDSEQPPRLLLWSSDGILSLHGMDGRRLAIADSQLRLNGVALSPNGERLAGYAADGTAIIWQLDDLSVFVRLDVANGFTAGPLLHVDWLDNHTLALADGYGLVQVVHQEDLTSSLPVSRFYGYGASDRLARAMRLADGRLLTAAYNDGGTASLRIWQLEPRPTPPGEGLPTAADGLCRRLQRAVTLPAGVREPSVLAWNGRDELLTTDGEGQFAIWPVGGTAHTLPPDPLRRSYAVAPDARRILRYGNGEPGEIWRQDADGWVLERTLPGELQDAVWTNHGLLITYADDSAVVLDPANGRAVSAPPGVTLSGATMPGPGLLLVLQDGAVELWQVSGAEPLATWPVPTGRRLRLDSSRDVGGSAAPRSDLFVYRDVAFGQLYVLRVDVTARTIAEVWRSEQAYVDRAPSRINPQLPLLAALSTGVVSLVDLDSGATFWQSSSVGAVTGQRFLSVSWSTDGQYLITQAEPLQGSTFVNTIGVWRWDPQARRLILLQQMPATKLLGFSPDLHAVLAVEAGRPFAEQPIYYPVLADAAQLQADVEASCLLDRPLRDDQRQAFLVGGR